MKDINTRLKKYSENVNVVVINDGNLRKKIIKFLIIAIVLLSVFYLLIFANMMSDVLSRKNSEIKIRNLTNEVNSLEAEYILASSNIDLNLSKSMGFVEAKTSFITYKTVSVLKNLAQNEI